MDEIACCVGSSRIGMMPMRRRNGGILFRDLGAGVDVLGVADLGADF